MIKDKNTIEHVYYEHKIMLIEEELKMLKKILAKENRSIITNKLNGAERTKKTLKRIHDAIEEYKGNQKITAKLISTISGLEINNVKRKWKYFKERARQLNAELKVRQK